MGVDDVDIVQLQSLQGLLDALTNVLAIGRKSRVDVFVLRCENFGRDDDLLARHLKVFEDLAESGLGLPVAVYLGCIEMVDSVLKTEGDDLLVLFVEVRLAVDGESY